MLTIGQRIKQARLDKGLTQKQLAELIGAKHNSISNWEKDQNKPDADTIEFLCNTLDIDANWLLGYNCSNVSDKKITEKEYELIEAYRNNPQMQSAIDKILGIENTTRRNAEMSADFSEVLNMADEITQSIRQK